MAPKKPVRETARHTWVKDTEDRSLSHGDRIRLFWDISRQASRIIEQDKSGQATAEMKAEIAKLCSSTASNARVNINQVSQYLRLCTLSKSDVSKLAKDADCRDPIEKHPNSLANEPAYKSRMTISHALLLAAVTDKDRRGQLLNDAIANHWPHKVLNEKSREVREGSIIHPVRSTGKKRVRNRATINALTTAAAELLKLLDELEDAAFAQAITRSDRRDPADTLEKLKNLVSTFEVIRKKLPGAKNAASTAAKNFERFLGQKTDQG